MTRWLRVKGWQGAAAGILRRFPQAIAWQSVLLITAVWAIWISMVPYKNGGEALRPMLQHILAVIYGSFGAWMLSVLLVLMHERNIVKSKRWISVGLSLLLFFGLYFLHDGVIVLQNDLHALVTAGTYLAMFFALLYVLEKDEKMSALSAFFAAYGASIGATLVFSLLFELCSTALWKLILTGMDPWIVSVISWEKYAVIPIVVGLSVFLAFLPKADASWEILPGLRKFLLYAVFPFSLILLAILYLYVGKIFYYQEMPVGTMNWYASIAMLGFVMFYAIFPREENFRPFARFRQLGFLIFAPILAVQLCGVYERHVAYGLTFLRYTSMICTACGMVALFFAARRKSPKCFYLFLVLVTLLFSLTPLNVIDVPKRAQQARLEALVEKYGLLEDGSFKMKDELSPKERKNILSAARYVGATYSPLAQEVLAREQQIREQGRVSSGYFVFRMDEKKQIPVKGFDAAWEIDTKVVSKEGRLRYLDDAGQEVYIDLMPHAERLLKEHKEIFETRSVTSGWETEFDVDRNRRVHFTSLSLERTDSGEIVLDEVQGILFLRK